MKGNDLMTFGAHVDEEILAEVCAAAFAPLARSDQRERGIEFVRGLLTARGRRSIRNIATGIGGRAANQRLHHFVSASTWDWTRVRRALAGHLEQIEPPQAWVVRHVVIPKSGRSSVGVERRYSASLGRVLSAQHAIGLWGVSHSVSCPVDWRLRIPEDWPADEARRNHAASPERAEGEDGHEGVLRLATGAPRSWGLPTRPVVLDARGSKIGPQGLVRELTRSGVPFLMRIGGDVAVGAADPALPQWEQPAAASLLMTAAGRLRRPIGPSVAAAVRVRLPGPDVARDPLVLLGIGHAGRWPAQTVAEQPDRYRGPSPGAADLAERPARTRGRGTQHPNGHVRLLGEVVRGMAPPYDPGVGGAPRRAPGPAARTRHVRGAGTGRLSASGGLTGNTRTCAAAADSGRRNGGDRCPHFQQPERELDLQGPVGALPVRTYEGADALEPRAMVFGCTCSSPAARVGLPPAAKYASRVPRRLPVAERS
jgi:hypothetical protein